MRPPVDQETDNNEHVGSVGRRMDEYWFRLTAYLSRPGWLLAAVLLVFIATRLWLLLGFTAQFRDSGGDYPRFARLGIDCQLAVYHDFSVEYPPVAWWLMAFPRLIDSEAYVDPAPPPQVAQRFFDWYFRCFHAEILLADMACLVLTCLIGRRMLPAASWVLPALYILLTVAQPHLLFDRLDIVLLLFFLLCIACWLRSLKDSPAANRWATASYLFLGLGISFKIMPVIFVPFLLLADFWAAGGMWRLAGRVLALAIGAVGPFLVYIPSAGWGVFSLFQYHSERGIHMESIWGSMMLVASAFGVPCNVIQSYGGFNLNGEWSGALKIVSNVSLLAMGAAFGLWALLRGRRFDRRLALDTAQLVLVNSVALSHVFSPQYLNWLIPLALLLALNIFPPNWIIWSGFAVLVVAIVGISSWLFPYHYMTQFIALQVLPVSLSVVRSTCLVGLALLLNLAFFAKYGLVSWQTERTAPAGLALAT